MRRLSPALLLVNRPEALSVTRVVQPDEDSRGYATVAARDLADGEVLFCEEPLIAVDPEKDPEWILAMRAALTRLSSDCAWQFCMAARCLREEDLPQPLPPGTTSMSDDTHRRMQELCGGCLGDGLEATELAIAAAEALMSAAEAFGEGVATWPRAAIEELGSDITRSAVVKWLGDRLDDAAHRVSRNGFQLIRPTSDGLFHRISYMNHCCAGLNNAAWSWNGAKNLLTCRTTRAVEMGEEITISYIAKPWCDMATRARRRYLKNNYNFVCLCKACCRPPGARSAESSGGVDGERKVHQVNSESKFVNLLARWLHEEGSVEVADEPEAETPEAPLPASVTSEAAEERPERPAKAPKPPADAAAARKRSGTAPGRQPKEDASNEGDN